ncbi:hypothetical protein PV325_005577 [Microctonus aethiopoides]|nr:hypothetical protein PV325_005577 [Microctonus aethiopoides]
MSKKVKQNPKLKFDIVYELTWLWFSESKNAGVPISGPQICMQAQAMYMSLGGTEDEFKAKKILKEPHRGYKATTKDTSPAEHHPDNEYPFQSFQLSINCSSQ